MEAQTQRTSAIASWVTGRQSYFLKVGGAPESDKLSMFSIRVAEKLGEPYRITLELTADAQLDRANYLGRLATFTIEPPALEWLDPAGNGETRTWDGCITHFKRTKKTRDFHAYEVVVESTLARLNLTKATRIYQDASAPEIIESILQRHGFEPYQYSFAKLRKAFPKLKFHMQHQMSDWAFIHLVMRQAGLFCYTRPSEFGEVVIFADDVDGVVYQPDVVVPYREATGLIAGREAIYELQAHSRQIPASVLVSDYNPASAWERFKAEADLARDDTTTYGQTYESATRHLDETSANWEARLRHEEAIAHQIVFAGKSTRHDFFAGLVVKTDESLPDAPQGLLLTEVVHEANRKRDYFNTFKAIPAERPYRIALDESNWPKIGGTLSGRITTRDDTEYGEPNEDGHYTARFDFDYDDWPQGGESVPMRLAKPYAGDMQTGFHFPPRRDTEVGIAFLNGDPRSPYIAHMHHHSMATDLITSRRGWNTRNTIRTPRNKMRMEDERGKEGIKLATEYSKTQLNLGYLVDSDKQNRGSGFELRSDEWGALRGGKGLFLSADAQQGAGGQTLDMTAAMTQLQTAQARMTSLADAVTKAKAVVADCEAQQTLLDTQIKDLQQAVLLASAPHGVALTSGEHMQLSAGGHLFTTTGGNADAAIGGNYTVAAGNAVSLFASAQGIKAIAADGPIDVEAQGATLNLAALKGVTVSSTDDAITLNAKTELTLVCGGAYVKLSSGGVEIGSPSDITLKGPLRIAGSATKQAALPLMPKQEPTGMQLWHTYPNGEPVKNASYRVDFPDGTSRTGKLDENGRGTIANAPPGGGAVKYFEDGYPLKDDERVWPEPDGKPSVQASADETQDALPSLSGPAMAAMASVSQAMPEAARALAAQVPALVSAAASGGVRGVVQAAGQTALQTAQSAALGAIAQELGQVMPRAASGSGPLGAGVPAGQTQDPQRVPILAKSLTSQ